MVIRSTVVINNDNDDNKPTCVLDQAVLNGETLSKMTDIGLSFFAELCGRNRGVFVLNPSNGHTYGCTEFPSNFAVLAGVEDKNVTLKDANAIKDAYIMGNVTAADTVKLLDYMIKIVYHSSGINVQQSDVYACSVGGLARLQCKVPVNTIHTIRSVTLTGLFNIPTPWATGGKLVLTEHESKSFYMQTDFHEMRAMGLNTVQIPVPLDIFSPNSPPGAYYPESGKLIINHVSDILDMVQAADLQAILVLIGDDNDEAVAAAATFATRKHGSVVFAITLPSAQSLHAARAAETDLKLFIPVTLGDLKDLIVPDANVFAALDLSHTTTVADVASSSPEMDRMKLFYHEAIACMSRSPLEFGACYRRVPVFVATGFDLAIDDCHEKDANDNMMDDDEKYYYTWTDYGQCNRFDETIASPWWHRHRQSLAARQLFAYEQGMGWSFAAWKLYGEDDDSNNDNSSIIDTPAKLLALKHVAAAGLFPSLLTKKSSNTIVAKYACLNPPVADFGLGDDTVAPTPGPPPDCGNGWWNETIQDCSYWIPPPPTEAPTPCPTPEPPLECNVTTTTPTAMAADIIMDKNAGGGGGGTSKTSLLMAAGAGALVAIIVGSVVNKVFGNNRNRRNAGYSEIPSHTS